MPFSPRAAMQTINQLRSILSRSCVLGDRESGSVGRLRALRLRALRRGDDRRFRTFDRVLGITDNTPHDYGQSRRRPWMTGDWAPSAASWWKRDHPIRTLRDVLVDAWEAKREDLEAQAVMNAQYGASDDRLRPEGWADGHPDRAMILAFGGDLDGEPEDIAQRLGFGMVRRTRANLDSTAEVWQEQPVPRVNRMIDLAPLRAPSLTWQEAIRGGLTCGNHYRYEVTPTADGGVAAGAARPRWTASRMAETVQFPQAAYLSRSLSGRTILHKALLIRTLVVLDAEDISWRPFSDRIVSVWPDGEVLCTNLRGDAATAATNRDY